MFSIKPGLEATCELLRRAGHPEKDMKFIHLAGTNGKGSTGAMLERALRAAGFATGFYSSPHLLDVRERFRVNGIAVSQEDFDHLSGELELLARQGGSFSYFEFTTVLAMMIFARAGVDVVVWETGMGGRLDATNVVLPIASVITNIALDHQAYLGNTIAEIAAEKAGIIKPDVPVFHGELPPEALAVIEARAAAEDAPCFGPEPAEDGDSVRYEERGGRICQIFHCDDEEVHLPLPGAMQRRNFRLAAAVLRYLAPRLHFDFRRALAGIDDVRWPGRCQRLMENVILDGGHNPDGLLALREALAESRPGEKFTILFAGFRDKDVAGSIALLAPIAREFFCVPLHEADRPAYSGEELAAMVAQCSAPPPPARNFDSAGEALRTALAENKGMILVAGSFYLVGEILRQFADPHTVLDLI